MLFRPTFCCNCGEKIERAEWKLWTSRRFCQLCATEFSLQDSAVKGVIILAGAIMVLGVARMFTPVGSPEVAAKRTVERPSQVIAEQNPAGATLQQPLSPPVLQSNAIDDRTPRTIAALPANKVGVQVETTEPIYICGAATKKGAPCSRKVKGNVRCWQHIGQQAMLPPDQLRVTP